MADDDFSIIRDEGTPPTYKFFNGKEWVDSVSGKYNDVVSPVDGSVVGRLPVVTKDEIDRALELASIKQAAWEQTPLNERIKIMHLAADYIRHYMEYLVNLMVMEIGKSIKESKSEINRTAELIDYYADEAQSIKGETLDSDNFPGYKKGQLCIMNRAAYGTVLSIAPFNYPVNLSASKIAPALLMGNAVAVKPPTQGGISGLHLVRLFQKAGVPEGVMCALTGSGAEIGDILSSHKNVHMVAFTGSSGTGLHIASHAPMKQLLFECGGNNPTIVLPDADMSFTASEIVKGAFSYAGQRCTAIKYVLSTQGIIDALLPLVKKQTEELVKVGDPRNPETKMVGPVISQSEAQHIKQVIDEAVSKGAKVEFGGTVEKTYVYPTIFSNAKPDMMVVSCEIFGPVLSFIAVSGPDEAVRIINSSMFGLQASIFTTDEGAGLALASKINVGTVQINGSPQRGPDHFPFLGVKESGVGVQGVRYSLEAMSRLKPVVINKPQ